MSAARDGDLVCQGCRGAIRAGYVEALGATWHPEHFRCAACDRPIAGTPYYEHGEAPYHEACYVARFVPRCAYCDRALVDGHLVDPWGTAFCREHEEAYPSCRFCGRLVPEGGRGRVAHLDRDARCRLCTARAVATQREARTRFAPLVRWAVAAGLTVPRSTRLRVELAEAAELPPDDDDPNGPDPLGRALTTRFLQNDRIVEVRLDKILVLRGLPTPLFEGVAIHELGHAWVAIHWVTGLPRWTEEGFCQLLSHRWYGDQATPEARFHAEQIERNPDPVYGEGFRRVRDAADSIGFAELLHVLRTGGDVPILSARGRRA